MGENGQPALRKRAWQPTGQGQVLHDSATQGHCGAGAFFRQADAKPGQAVNDSEMETPAYFARTHPVVPLGMSLGKKFQCLELSDVIIFNYGTRINTFFVHVLYRFEPDGRLAFIGNAVTQAKHGRHGVEQPPATGGER